MHYFTGAAQTTSSQAELGALNLGLMGQGLSYHFSLLPFSSLLALKMDLVSVFLFLLN